MPLTYEQNIWGVLYLQLEQSYASAPHPKPRISIKREMILKTSSNHEPNQSKSPLTNCYFNWY